MSREGWETSKEISKCFFLVAHCWRFCPASRSVTFFLFFFNNSHQLLRKTYRSRFHHGLVIQQLVSLFTWLFFYSLVQKKKKGKGAELLTYSIITYIFHTPLGVYWCVVAYLFVQWDLFVHANLNRTALIINRWASCVTVLFDPILHF